MNILSNQKGVAQILVILLLLAGIGTGVYLVQKQTNIFPKAYNPTKSLSGPISPKQEYTLIPSTTSVIYLSNSSSNPRSGYLAKVTLKDKTGMEVANQRNMVYTWTASNPEVVNIIPSAYCAPGVSEPCPQAQAQLAGGTAGLAQVNVVVTRNRKILAQTSFNVSVAQPTPTSTPIPIPSPIPQPTSTPVSSN